jgi:hypothetical protein
MKYRCAREKIVGLIDAVLLYNEDQSLTDKPEFIAITAAMLNKLSKFVTGVTADKTLVRAAIEDNDYRIKDQQDQLQMSDHLTLQKHPITECLVLTNRRLDSSSKEQLFSKIQDIFKEL